MAHDASISRSVLSEQIKDRLLGAILDGRYAPGARIVETRVARELGTSQAPVREALRDLEALGVVETSAFRGARVRSMTPAELLEAFVVRAELESLAARLAVTRLTDADLAHLGDLVVEMQRAADESDRQAEASADASFHGCIVALSGNRTLERVWRTLEPYFRTYITIAAPGADRRAIADHHLPVLEALRSRDPDLITKVLHRHFEDAAAVIAAMASAAGEPGEPERVSGPASPIETSLGTRPARRAGGPVPDPTA